MNKIILIGNLTKDPELRATQAGKSVCAFSIAVNRKTASGEKVADFFRINAWGKLGENCARYLKKGGKAAVVGELRASTYEDKHGKTRVSLDVFAEQVEFLTQAADTKPETDDYGFSSINTDDCPF